jgi:hypothetical protein
MTFKQLLLRYLKENGYYPTLSRIGYSKLVKNNMSSNATELLRLADYILRISGINWFYHGDRMHLFLKDWTNIDLKIKKGDIVTVETLDGKYSYEFEVFEVWIYDYTISLASGGKISIERIKAVNGKLVDFKNNWDFKRNLNYIH